MTDVNARVVEIARDWIGTPYQHQCATRHAGTDCLGLIRGIWGELYGPEPVEVPAYSADWGEPQHREVLWDAARRYLVEATDRDPLPGEVLLFRMRERSIAKHLGIRAEQDGQPTVIHAYSGHCVVETPLGPAWQRRVVARFRFPEDVS